MIFSIALNILSSLLFNLSNIEILFDIKGNKDIFSNLSFNSGFFYNKLSKESFSASNITSTVFSIFDFGAFQLLYIVPGF